MSGRFHYPSHLVKPHDTVDLLVRKIARWCAVERHTPPPIADEGAVAYLDRAFEIVEAAVARYEADPEVRTEAQELLLQRAG
jgi:hypothetical protein